MGAVAIARHFGDLLKLGILKNNLGQEGIKAVSNGLPSLTYLDIGFNELFNGCASICKLPNLKKLHSSTFKLNLVDTGAQQTI